MNARTLHLQRLLKRLFIFLITLVTLTFLIIQNDTHQNNTFEIFESGSENDWNNYDFSNLPIDKGNLNKTAHHEFVFKNIRSLPLEYWSRRESKSNKLVCGGLKSIYDLKFSNNYWQILNHSNATFYLLNSYYDNRTKSGRPTIRTIGTVDRLNWKHNITCQIWFDDNPYPTFVPVAEYKYMWLSSWGYKSEDYQHPYLISCDIPEPLWNKTPVAVSLVENKCDKATNLLKIHNRKPVSGQKEDFAVCVKGLSYQYNDQSVILIEWLETLFEMGVSKVIIYVLNVHPNIWKVLEYYLSLGKIELREHTLSGHGPNIPAFQHDFLYNKVGWKRLQELIPYNDCYYDNLNLYKFIALLDIDELIVPKGHLSTWQQLFVFLQPTLKHKPADIDGYGFRDVLFLDEHHTYENIAPYLRFANTIVRASEHMKVGHGTKSWFSTESILTLHNHYSFNLLSPNRKARNKKWHEVDPNVAQMQHYCFNRNCNKLNSTILDTNLWKYKDTVTPKSLKVLEDLGFITRKKP